MKKKYLECGKILGTHGIRGDMKVEYWFDDFKAFKKVKELYLDEDGLIKYNIVSIKEYNAFALVHFENIDTPESAGKLRSRLIYVNRDDIVRDKSKVLVADLIDMPVVDGDTGVEYGTLIEISDNGASELLNVKGKNGTLILIPKIPGVVEKFTPDMDKIVVHPMEGLIDEV